MLSAICHANTGYNSTCNTGTSTLGGQSTAAGSRRIVYAMLHD